MSASPVEIREKILELLSQQDPGKTICPSDAARALAGDSEFRPLMQPVRAVAQAMADAGELTVTQRGRRVSAIAARGPIRLGHA